MGGGKNIIEPEPDTFDPLQAGSSELHIHFASMLRPGDVSITPSRIERKYEGTAVSSFHTCSYTGEVDVDGARWFIAKVEMK